MAYTTINKPSDYFNTSTWTGDGSSSRNITGVGFQPDLVWGKCRNASVSHAVYDSVRGASNLINTNTTSAEGTNGALNAFISDGFTVNSDSYLNANTNTYVGWNWLAGGTASSNTDGSITSTVSANTTSGFSIVSYTGTGANATIGHGLGVAPNMIIVKRRDGADGWKVYNSPRGATKYLQLNTADVEGTLSTQWNDTEPTSSVFSVGTAGDINGSGRTYIAYCFANKKGFSKIGSYTGNGNADGTFVYTGFKPAFVMIKNTGAAEFWSMFDNKRDPHNQMDKKLYPNGNNAESTTSQLDFVSNGFKLRNSESEFNQSGNTMIYMCFAEEPLVGDNPATAR